MAYSKKSRAAAGVAVAVAVLAAGVSSEAGAFAADTTEPVQLGAEFTDRIAARAAGGTVIPVTVTGGTVGATASAFSALRISARVGGAPAPVGWVDETHLKVTAPATTKATAVTMQLFRKGTAGPESSATVAYYPGVVAATPSKISSLGGATVTVSGTGFLGVNPDDPEAVTIGDVAATSVTVISGTKLTAVAPAGTNGTAVVRVKTDGGASDVTPGGRVTYRAALGVDTGPGPTAKASGGPLVLAVDGGTIGTTAKEFAAERITVTMERRALTVTWVDESHLKVIVPPLAADSAQVTLVHDGIAGPPAEVSVAPVVTGLSVKSDTIAGGATVKVKIAGAGADSSTSFTFGDTAAECTKQGAGTTLAFICTAPAAAQAGPVAVRFTSGTGKASRFTAAAMFSYTDN